MWDKAIEALAPLLIIGLFIVVRLVRVLTAHQQKMTEILSRSTGDHAEIASLRHEISEIKSLMHEHVLNSDDRKRLTSPPPTPDLAERLKSQG
jgi:hypothetical protein